MCFAAPAVEQHGRPAWITDRLAPSDGRDSCVCRSLSRFSPSGRHSQTWPTPKSRCTMCWWLCAVRLSCLPMPRRARALGCSCGRPCTTLLIPHTSHSTPHKHALCRHTDRRSTRFLMAAHAVVPAPGQEWAPLAHEHASCSPLRGFWGARLHPHPSPGSRASFSQALSSKERMGKLLSMDLPPSSFHPINEGEAPVILDRRRGAQAQASAQPTGKEGRTPLCSRALQESMSQGWWGWMPGRRRVCPLAGSSHPPSPTAGSAALVQDS